jgi:hypothetical protein
MTRPPTNPSGRSLRVTVRTTAKRDKGPDEKNEDSAAGNIDAGRFAVSDGASMAARSDIWSRLLTEAFVHGNDPLADDTRTTLRQCWWERAYKPGLRWHARDKLARGSAATFLGLRVAENTYHLTAVGDSCLFHLAGKDLVLVAPLTDWTDFSRFPELVHTTPVVPADHVWTGGGALGDGDVLLLTTDAVAKYLLRRHSETGELPPILDHLGDEERFTHFIEQAREQGLDNDDSTVCVVWT